MPSATAFRDNEVIVLKVGDEAIWCIASIPRWNFASKSTKCMIWERGSQLGKGIETFVLVNGREYGSAESEGRAGDRYRS